MSSAHGLALIAEDMIRHLTGHAALRCPCDDIVVLDAHWPTICAARRQLCGAAGTLGYLQSLAGLEHSNGRSEERGTAFVAASVSSRHPPGHERLALSAVLAIVQRSASAAVDADMPYGGGSGLAGGRAAPWGTQRAAGLEASLPATLAIDCRRHASSASSSRQRRSRTEPPTDRRGWSPRRPSVEGRMRALATCAQSVCAESAFCSQGELRAWRPWRRRGSSATNAVDNAPYSGRAGRRLDALRLPRRSASSITAPSRSSVAEATLVDRPPACCVFTLRVPTRPCARLWVPIPAVVQTAGFGGGHLRLGRDLAVFVGIDKLDFELLPRLPSKRLRSHVQRPADGGGQGLVRARSPGPVRRQQLRLLVGSRRGAYGALLARTERVRGRACLGRQPHPHP